MPPRHVEPVKRSAPGVGAGVLLVILMLVLKIDVTTLYLSGDGREHTQVECQLQGARGTDAGCVTASRSLFCRRLVTPLWLFSPVKMCNLPAAPFPALPNRGSHSFWNHALEFARERDSRQPQTAGQSPSGQTLEMDQTVLMGHNCALHVSARRCLHLSAPGDPHPGICGTVGPRFTRGNQPAMVARTCENVQRAAEPHSAHVATSNGLRQPID